jgi:hypothetical protein
MDYVMFWLKLLFLVFLLRQSDADSEQCCARLEGDVLKIKKELEYLKETLVS